MAFLADPRLRAIGAQALLLVLIAAVLIIGVTNAADNLREHRIATGFEFFDEPAGFGINQTLIPYSEADSYGRVFLVGVLNTLLVSALGIVFATIIGFVIGIARLSSNWLVARAAGIYVEALRNVPLLFQILFWYLAVLRALPTPRQSLSVGKVIFFNNRGVMLPNLSFGAGAGWLLAALAIGVAAMVVSAVWSRRRRERSGHPLPLGWVALGCLVVWPLAVLAVSGFPVRLELPELRGFNFAGGIKIIPEFVALLVALSTYTAAFIAEIVRAGILSVPRGQTEASYALGLTRGRMLRLVIVPQALRLIVPPLTSQYLNLTKNSSLAVAIGYPDLFAVFAGTTLNQTGQAIEIIAVTMLVYLAISLVTSLAMNLYNARGRVAQG
jgi:general L-amino acid transport system permease protein